MRKINEKLGRKGKRLIKGEKMWWFEWEMMKRIKNIRVEGKYLIEFDINVELEKMWK